MKRLASADLFAMKWVSDPQISPNGRSVLFTVKTVIEEGKARKYRTVIFAAREGNVFPFTNDPRSDTAPRWSPSGDRVAFLSEREKGRPQLYLIPADGGEALQLTSRKDGAGEPVWSPDGRKIAFCALESDPEDGADEIREVAGGEKSDVSVITRLGYKLNGRGILPDRRTQVYVLDVGSREVKQLTSGAYNCRDVAWSPDGTYVVFVSARFEGYELTSVRDLFVVPAEGGEMRKLTSSDAVLGLPSYSPDGRWIACYGHDNAFKEATVAGVAVVPAAGGPPAFLTRETEAAAGHSAGGDMGGSPVTRPAWGPDGGTLYFGALERGRTHIYSADLSDKTVAQVTLGDCTVSGWTKAAGSDTFALHWQSPTVIGDIVVVDRSGSSAWNSFPHAGPELEPFAISAGQYEVRRVTSVNQGLLSEVYLSVPEELEAVSPDGATVQTWVMRPVGMTPGRKYPVALEIHGGPHAAYGFVFHHEFQVLCSRGYGVVFCNPRGSVGYGQGYLSAIRHDWGGADYRDIMAAVELAASLPWADPERMGVLGGSYGGYMTNWAISHTDRFKAAVTMRSTCNRMSQFGASDAAFRNGEFEFDGDPWDNPEAYLRVSPLMYVRRVNTPVMIIHSEQDLRCPISQGEEWFVALKKTGKTAVMVRFPEENHELSRSGRPKHRVERLEYILAWFDRYLKPRSEDYEVPLEKPEKPVVRLPDAAR